MRDKLTSNMHAYEKQRNCSVNLLRKNNLDFYNS